jgi:hypothetical protein
MNLVNVVIEPEGETKFEIKGQREIPNVGDSIVVGKNQDKEKLQIVTVKRFVYEGNQLAKIILFTKNS